MGSATTLLDADANIDAATRRELLTAIHDEADRLGRLLNNLLAMTRIEGGGLEVKADWQVPEETVGAAIRRLGERARGRAIEVRIDPAVELVAFDGLMIELVLINLLDNALKYTPEGSPIEIGVAAADGEVVFAILDHGPGIPAAERERVFAKFFRGDGASGLAGAGLGLAISKAVVEAHGGRIVAGARDDGPGARFAFTIPTSTPPPAPGDSADAEAA
jgi:two-component system sensor histidine kinase KdpD